MADEDTAVAEEQVAAEGQDTEAQAGQAEQGGGNDAQIAELKAEIEALKQQRNEGVNPADPQQVNEYWEQLFGNTESEQADDGDATSKKMDQLLKMNQQLMQRLNAQEACNRYRREVSDWADHEDDILAEARKHPGLSDEDYYVLVKARKQGIGFKGAKGAQKQEAKATLSPEAEQAKEAELQAKQEKLERAKKAASEKPTGGGKGATPTEYSSIGESAKAAMAEIGPMVLSE